MKKILLFVASVLLLAACSTPRYTYYFDHYDYNSGKKKVDARNTVLAQHALSTPEMSALKLNSQAVTASAERRIQNVENVPVTVSSEKSILGRKYSSLSKSEKKEFRKELKSEVKKVIKARKSGESISSSISAVKVMDHDLKMALIFAIVGIILSAFGGVNSLFWILGTISVVIALVFLIIWISNQ
jgi:uncharacterized membrane protein